MVPILDGLSPAPSALTSGTPVTSCVAICKKYQVLGAQVILFVMNKGDSIDGRRKWNHLVPKIQKVKQYYHVIKHKKSSAKVIRIDEQNESNTQHLSPKNLDNYRSFDSEFNSILQSLEKDHLNFSDVDANDLGEVSSAIDRNYDGSIHPLGTIRSNDVTSNQCMNEIEPVNKRMKLTSSKQDDGINDCLRSNIDNDGSDEQIDQLCNEVIEKCLLDDFKN